ncbi:MAG: ADP-forming succinate--CoA ligase subunit beta [Planctomycetes bacterium]|nr:ADP-forming succinate--CoA ligase subunit beta [Planctomycetota bacterium]MCH2584876.1 ADP-forming succinate--CoA ligase subunit beta [Planctomycetota bacterium]
MKIHEYQAKEVLAAAGVPVPPGEAVDTVDAAVAAAEALGGSLWVVKAQIHAGGRGKGGGVKLASSLEEVREYSDAILGMQLVTPQTGPEGREVKKILIAAACDIASEFYAGIVLDRQLGLPVLMVSAEGGMDIEEVAASTPEKIFKVSFDPSDGLSVDEAREVAGRLGLEDGLVEEMAGLLQKLARCFLDTDASLAEINPLVRTTDDSLLALDAKFSFDDNALFRHPELVEYRDPAEEDPLETRAAKFGLSYIKLDGEIGCMVNGAGLAMATLDIIKHFGGEAANFLDVGGGATTEKVTEAFKIILEDSDVKAILVNIFGGIMKCDVIAEGIIEAAQTIELRVPVVVRLEGTNVERGRELLAGSGLDLISAPGLPEAVESVVAQAKGGADS